MFLSRFFSLSIWPVLTFSSHAKYSYKYMYFRKVGQFTPALHIVVIRFFVLACAIVLIGSVCTLVSNANTRMHRFADFDPSSLTFDLLNSYSVLYLIVSSPNRPHASIISASLGTLNDNQTTQLVIARPFFH